MIRKSQIIYLNISVGLLLFALFNFPLSFNKTGRQENTPPVVKITSPKNNSVFDFNNPISYEISVADKEDGNSKYDEINAKEVLLQVSHVARLSAVTTGVQPDAPGIAVMRASNCFNCHNFNSKSIGPSFYEIGKKYPATKPNIDTLVKHIKDGSSGTWGKEKMPTHTELTSEEIKSTVQWILKKATDPNVDYYIGLTGSLRFKPPVGSRPKGLYLLTASYLDHGLKGAPGKQRLKGEDVVVIYSR